MRGADILVVVGHLARLAHRRRHLLVVVPQFAQHLARRHVLLIVVLHGCNWATCPIDRIVVPPILRTRSASVGRGKN